MGRRRGGNPFTLFSFQDIITSVMGIMLLAALMLALELVTRTAARSPPVDPARLRATVAARQQTLQVDLAELKKRLEELQRNTQAAAATVVADSEYADRRAAEETARLKAELAELKKALEQTQKTETDGRARSFDRRDDRRRARELAETLAAVKAELGELQGNNQFFYRPLPGLGKQTWLVEVADGRILVGRLDNDVQARACRVERRFAGPEAFIAFAATLSPRSDFFMILLRPDAVDPFMEILEDLRTKKYDFGYDVIGHGPTVFVETGRP